MFYKLFSYIFNIGNKRNFNKLQSIVDRINYLENDFEKFTDNELKNNTFIYKSYLKNNINNIYNILPEVYSNIREAIKRIFNIRLFNVQLFGAIVLHNGCIAEMKTGEGKTITSTLPAYLNCLLGYGVHIVTVNDYLAKRDFINNYKLFDFLGISIGLILSNMSLLDKKKSYLCDITYGTNNEYCFDYLRDNMSYNKNDIVQRKFLNFAILDEVDSILIDESRTPIIISGSIKSNNDIYFKINKIIPFLKVKDKFNYIKGDFIIDEKSRNIYLTEKGIYKVEDLLIKNNFINKDKYFYNFHNIKIINYVICSLKAHYLFKKNIDYLVKDNNIVIIDEFTGRIVPDKRWSDGLHQAIEAKENVQIKDENQILASITFQNYFKLYKKLSGMSGTVLSESYEFNSIYNLDTIEIPTNKKIIRNDLPDLIYLNEDEKIKSIINDIKIRYKKGQPVLVGTTSIDKSELISRKLKEINIKHKILNAKYHKFEAKIISEAGKLGSVTIATNMAGRGTDIILGGNLLNELNKKNYINKKDIKKKWIINNKLVIKLGGLHIIGSERHESRRIDDQLRGRSGRQGDPGSTRFYVSLDDSLIRIFLSKRIINFIKDINIDKNISIENSLLNKYIEKAQRNIEYRNFEIRKQLLEFDNITNNQRNIIYNKRNKILFSDDLNLDFKIIIKKLVNKVLNKFNVNNFLLYYKKIKKIIYINFNFKIKFYFFNELNFKKFKKLIINKLILIYNNKIKFLGFNFFKDLEKNIMLKTLDFFWREYLLYINYFKEYIYLRSYAQIDPKKEYEIETLKIFLKMLNNFNFEVIKIIFSLPNNINNLDKFLLNFNINLY